MKRPRLRKWAKWGCTVAAVVASSSATASRFYAFRYVMVTADKQMAWVPFLQAGLLGVAKLSGPMADRTTRFVLQRRQEWHWGFSSEDPQSVWHGGICYSVKPYVVEVGVSVLYPVLLTTIPAALLWYADRRRFGLHACKKCNYDRRGLPPDAKCPECGTVPDPASK